MGTQKQHYVPQFLLRNFSSGSKKNPKIWVLDKRSKHVWLSSIREVAHENAFYEFHNGEKHLELENLMQRIDSMGARIIKRVIDSGHLWLPVEDKIWFSYFIACQIFRTPMIRKDMDNLREIFIRNWGRGAKVGDDSRTLGEYSSEDSKLSSLQLLQEVVPEFARLLQTRVWFLAQSPPRYPFIISDSPVVRHNMIRRKGRGNLGLNNFGIEVYMPLSRRYCLHMICPDLARIASKAPEINSAYSEGIKRGKAIPMAEENVTFANSCQVIWAERYVFGHNKEELALPLDMLRTNPDLMNGAGVGLIQ